MSSTAIRLLLHPSARPREDPVHPHHLVSSYCRHRRYRYRPHHRHLRRAPLRKIKITVDDASLTRFDLLTDPTTRLAYNLMLTMSVRNPNWAIGIKHDKPLEAAYSFDGQQFDRVQVVDKGEKQGPRKTVVYRLDTNSVGRGIALGNAGEAEFKKEKEEEGVFEVEVKLTGKFKYRLRYTKCEFEATCPVKMQLEAPGAPAVVFQKVDCELTKSDDNNCKMVY
ncbi:hypothetical protein PR202_ga30430 [Eleusine coracana subsp. coracana]|uniref:Late embryogenesis abundant protein LEA-2 subgroup domain-containing protein n=1 Tax=Eleusine coracana subsp. coracana TaxID=191504 RepID=A0AAV5DQL4_ELECO|nr:hypothetical protein PR202_ga30430 [Eleusine coracana subsp. coracana]